jgi:hypothetical protein
MHDETVKLFISSIQGHVLNERYSANVTAKKML